jgi:hypothetical protein
MRMTSHLWSDARGESVDTHRRRGARHARPVNSQVPEKEVGSWALEVGSFQIEAYTPPRGSGFTVSFCVKLWPFTVSRTV